MATYKSIAYDQALANPSAMVLLQTETASASGDVSFTSGIDSTYKEYIFKFIHMHPATDDAEFSFNGSTDGGSNYNVTKTTTYFAAWHNEGGTSAALEYNASRDIAQGTGFQAIISGGSGGTGNGNDECCSGFLHLFNPSDTTFVKQFISTGNDYQNGDYCMQNHVAGYFNTTSAIDAIQFKFDNGNTDAGIIKLYGVN